MTRITLGYAFEKQEKYRVQRMEWARSRFNSWQESTEELDSPVVKGFPHTPKHMPEDWGDFNQAGVRQTSKDLEDWVAVNRKCRRCGKVIRAWDQKQQSCYYERMA